MATENVSLPCNIIPILIKRYNVIAKIEADLETTNLDFLHSTISNVLKDESDKQTRRISSLRDNLFQVTQYLRIHERECRLINVEDRSKRQEFERGNEQRFKRFRDVEPSGMRFTMRKGMPPGYLSLFTIACLMTDIDESECIVKQIEEFNNKLQEGAVLTSDELALGAAMLLSGFRFLKKRVKHSMELLDKHKPVTTLSQQHHDSIANHEGVDGDKSPICILSGGSLSPKGGVFSLTKTFSEKYLDGTPSGLGRKFVAKKRIFNDICDNNSGTEPAREELPQPPKLGPMLHLLSNYITFYYPDI